MTSSSIHNPNNKLRDQQQRVSFPKAGDAKSETTGGGAIDSSAYDEIIRRIEEQWTTSAANSSPRQVTSGTDPKSFSSHQSPSKFSQHGFRMPSLTQTHLSLSPSSPSSSIRTSLSSSPQVRLTPLTSYGSLLAGVGGPHEQDSTAPVVGFGEDQWKGLGISFDSGGGPEDVPAWEDVLGRGAEGPVEADRLGAISFRQGDWICASDTCSFHNFSRNDHCISCNQPKPVSHPESARSLPCINRTIYTSPHPRNPYASLPSYHSSPDTLRHYSTPRTDSPGGFARSSPTPITFGDSIDYHRSSTSLSHLSHLSALRTQQQKHQTQHQPIPVSLPLSPPPPFGYSASSPKARGDARSEEARMRSVSHPSLPSMMGVGEGQVNPNQIPEETPLVPILNTGNSGPMTVQPGDWACGQCGFTNWRRRRVCLRCFPFAEGNELSGASLANAALLAAKLAESPMPITAAEAIPHHSSTSSPTKTFAHNKRSSKALFIDPIPYYPQCSQPRSTHQPSSSPLSPTASFGDRASAGYGSYDDIDCFGRHALSPSAFAFHSTNVPGGRGQQQYQG